MYQDDSDNSDNSYDNDRQPAGPLKRSWAATYAGTLWVGLGIVILLNAVINMAIAVLSQEASAIGRSVCGTVLGCFFGGVFIHVGRQTLSGLAKDTLGNGIGSIVFGLLYSALGSILLLAVISLGIGSAESFILIAIGAINVICAVALLFAGILAISARADYKAWRKSVSRKTNA